MVSLLNTQEIAIQINYLVMKLTLFFNILNCVSVESNTNKNQVIELMF